MLEHVVLPLKFNLLLGSVRLLVRSNKMGVFQSQKATATVSVFTELRYFYNHRSVVEGAYIVCSCQRSLIFLLVYQIT